MTDATYFAFRLGLGSEHAFLLAPHAVRVLHDDTLHAVTRHGGVGRTQHGHTRQGREQRPQASTEGGQHHDTESEWRQTLGRLNRETNARNTETRGDEQGVARCAWPKTGAGHGPDDARRQSLRSSPANSVQGRSLNCMPECVTPSLERVHGASSRPSLLPSRTRVSPALLG